LGLLDPAVPLFNIRFWHRIAKKHHIWLQDAVASGAMGDFNAAKIQLYIRIAIRCWRKSGGTQPWILLLQPILYGASVELLPTFQTADPIQTSVQIEHMLLPSSLMQPVHILRNDSENLATLLKRNQSTMRVIRLRLRKFRIAELTARPIALPPVQMLNECLMLNRPRAFP